jgi:3'-phosphoadenosine 5'-phosphosulfate sulfotransferase (PAPS reductase)/FAD synthetase
MLINHIGVSGGKDSTSLLLWAVHESGYDPNSLDATFCDTGNEHQITYDYIRKLSETVWPITTIQPPLSFFELAKKKKRFPSAKARFCTVELKIKPTLRYISALFAQGNTVRLHSGVRAGESDARSKMLEREFDGNMLCEVYRPLLKWSIADVWALHAKYGLSRNALYDHGAKRVGCLPCCMSRKEEVRLIGDKFPETIDRIRAAEKDSLTWGRKGKGFGASFFPRSTVPLVYRSHKFIRDKDGAEFMVAGIDDVIRWAQTERGAKQIMVGRDPLQPTFDFIKRTMDDVGKDEETHNCQSGFCE